MRAIDVTLGLSWLWIFQAIAQVSIDYTVSLPAPQTQTVEIRCRFSGLTGNILELKLPVWRPGKYQVLNPAGTLYNFRATDEDGKMLKSRKTDKSTWSILLGGSSGAIASYSLYANSLVDRTRHVDDTHAFLSGSSVFLYAPAFRDQPIRVHVEAPGDWSIGTGLKSDPTNPSVLLADSYDILVDSPLEIGKQSRHLFRVHDRPHEIIVWGKADYDPSELMADFAAIVEDQIDLWGQPPYERYVFLIHVGPGLRGGTEHLNSTIMQTTREHLEDPKLYKEFLGLVSHEFFHTWNIKQIRPAGLSPYEYQEENYTPLLWLVEGTTSYYDDLSLARAGLIEPKEYLERISKLIDAFRRTPGRRVQSLADASFDVWIKFTHPTPDSPNRTISFYSKGALVSLLLDQFIRESTSDQHSLDNVLRVLYERYPLGESGYQVADVRAVVEEIAGVSCDTFFGDYVEGVMPLELEAALSRVGLKLDLQDESESDEETTAGDEAYLGITLKGNDVVNVLSDGPAYAAGVMAGDELVAIDARKLEPDSLTKQLKKLGPGSEITLTLFRRDQLRHIPLVLGKRPRGKWTVSVSDSATTEQKAAFKSWMHQDWVFEVTAPLKSNLSEK
ncbi:MAG: hypothetical protein M2R45_05001 [Verrucomicrobia subdivision 3 bacterium]|nr:hypothetical protein [Limisphaerales bacterium]MCS1415598.1 hypothetical protein [Limisphaerales bacterium]